MIRKHFENYNFVGIPETGITFRWGNEISENPIEAPWPELADISISNYCNENCRYCYRSSSENGKFMPLDEYELVLEELTHPKFGSVFQVALGGGEPLLHPAFEEILELTSDYSIIPNYTTNGKHFNEKNLEATKKYCGAIAISFDPYRNLTLEELSDLGILFQRYNIKSNIHFVLSEKTLIYAIELLKGKYDEYFTGFNSLIFLTYKPFGKANSNDAIHSEELLLNFLNLIDNPITSIKIGFDACFIPILFKKTNVNHDLVDSCECGYFSVYIDENLNVMPCSFCNDDNFKFNLKEFSFDEIWNKQFEDYKKNISDYGLVDCEDCDELNDCRGKCPFFEELFLCDIIS